MPNLMDRNHAPKPSNSEAKTAAPKHELTLRIEEYTSARLELAILEFQRMPPADIEREKGARGLAVDEATEALDQAVNNLTRAARRAGV